MPSIIPTRDYYTRLSEPLIKKVAQQREGQKYFVGLVGTPGSGKTTTCQNVCNIINEKCGPNTCVVVPMDGFHKYKSELDQMEDPAEAYRRRGAPYTFNAEAFLNLLHKLKQEGHGFAPSFDHNKGDPIEDDIEIRSEHKIVLVEGLYLLLEEKYWEDIKYLLDEKWFIDCDIDVAMERLRVRHMGTGLTNEQALHRIETNDRPNGLMILATKKHATRILDS